MRAEYEANGSRSDEIIFFSLSILVMFSHFGRSRSFVFFFCSCWNYLLTHYGIEHMIKVQPIFISYFERVTMFAFQLKYHWNYRFLCNGFYWLYPILQSGALTTQLNLSWYPIYTISSIVFVILLGVPIWPIYAIHINGALYVIVNARAR